MIECGPHTMAVVYPKLRDITTSKTLNQTASTLAGTRLHQYFTLQFWADSSALHLNELRIQFLKPQERARRPPTALNVNKKVMTTNFKSHLGKQDSSNTDPALPGKSSAVNHKQPTKSLASRVSRKSHVGQRGIIHN
ncbi:hypothetical protein ACTXT7_002478 [Hymenolepis weldensis]